MTITAARKSGQLLVITEDGVEKKYSIVYADTVVSKPIISCDQIGNIYRRQSDGKLVLQYGATEMVLDPAVSGGDMTKAVYDSDADGVIAKAQLDAALANTSGTNTGDQTLAGLGGIAHSLATALNDVLMASGAGAFVKQTLVQLKTALAIATDIATHAALTATHGVAGTIAGLADIVATKLDNFATPDDNTDLDTSTTQHGLAPKAVAPAAGLINVLGLANGETAITNKALFDATSPSIQAIGDAAAVGTAVVATRRDHKHAMPSQATMDTASVAAVAAAGVVLATAKYIEITTPSGDHTACGWAKTETAGIALVFGEACYVGIDGKMEKALADDAAITIPATHLCLATIAEDATGLFLLYGEAYDASWAFDIGLSVYLSAATLGLITKTMPVKVTGNQVQVLGTAKTTAKIQWSPSLVVLEYL